MAKKVSRRKLVRLADSIRKSTKQPQDLTNYSLRGIRNDLTSMINTIAEMEDRLAKLEKRSAKFT